MIVIGVLRFILLSDRGIGRDFAEGFLLGFGDREVSRHAGGALDGGGSGGG